ncbi:hypothetical protein BVC80_8251g5 [Macleaya cordata]|uniref:Uncharacterized protein n=1 Tax=Macleaya cordata TaxID=56857 RepID=A0A200Q458_MACCD|nr:hypothetical protein BVC80_8251g5 [Macleaya cordata]
MLFEPALTTARLKVKKPSPCSFQPRTLEESKWAGDLSTKKTGSGEPFQRSHVIERDLFGVDLVRKTRIGVDEDGRPSLGLEFQDLRDTSQRSFWKALGSQGQSRCSASQGGGYQ